jgi:RimJ/RimL family protein N-acetyltransferase
MNHHDVYPLTLVSVSIRIREFHPADLDATMGIVGDPEVTNYLSFDAKSREDQQQLLSAQIARAQQKPRSEYYQAIERLSDGELLGFVRLGLGTHATAKLGYALRHDAWGKGFATEAAAAMIEFGFNALSLHRITAACGPENAGSIRVLEKLGFSYEGRLREHVFTNGRWRDSLLYSRLALDASPGTDQ